MKKVLFGILVVLSVSGAGTQQPKEIPIVTIETIGSMPNHRTYKHLKLCVKPAKDGKVVDNVYLITADSYRVGKEDLAYFPYGGGFAREALKLNPSGLEAQSVTFDKSGNPVWDLTKLNRLLGQARVKENQETLRRLNTIDPKKAQMLASLRGLKGLYTAGFSEYGLHIHIDRKTGCFNQGDLESQGKSPVEPAVVKAIKQILGVKEVRFSQIGS